MFKYTDVPAFAAKYHRGDRTAAVEALIRNGPNVKYVPNNAYADAKLIIAWWVAALARRLPSGMAVYAVSPGGATATDALSAHRAQGCWEEKSLPETLTTACHAASWLARSWRCGWRCASIGPVNFP